jgi:hypothetical protein
VRQLLFVVMLVSASFLGGAFVNGPGLQWIQAKLLQSLRLNNGGEIALIELKSGTSAELESKARVGESAPTDRVQAPLAPVPSFQTDNNGTGADMPDQLLGTKHRPHLGAKDSVTLASRGLSPSLPERPMSIGTEDGAALPHPDGTIKPVGNRVPQSSISPSSPSSGDTAPALLDSLAALVPVDPSISKSSPHSLSSEKSTLTLAGNEAGSWILLERKLQSLGVARFTVEGVPGGSVVFSCLIPVAGRQAVTQRFEGEGDDIIHAAQVTMRRIALWRASQPVSH